MEMSEKGILKFNRMFDSEGVANSSKTNSFEASLSSKVYLEFTINLPRKKSFISSGTEQQKDMYLVKLTKALSLLEFKWENLKYTFETCESGMIHMHGCIQVMGLYYVEGIVTDFARKLLTAIDARMSYNKGEYYRLFQRYRSPAICVQYSDSPEREKYWDQYINKNM
jgi:hypothetical protein